MRTAGRREGVLLFSAAALSFFSFRQLPLQVAIGFPAAAAALLLVARKSGARRFPTIFLSLFLAGSAASFALFAAAALSEYPRSLSLMIAGAYSYLGFFAGGIFLGLAAEFAGRKKPFK